MGTFRILPRPHLPPVTVTVSTISAAIRFDYITTGFSFRVPASAGNRISSRNMDADEHALDTHTHTHKYTRAHTFIYRYMYINIYVSIGYFLFVLEGNFFFRLFTVSYR